MKRRRDRSFTDHLPVFMVGGGCLFPPPLPSAGGDGGPYRPVPLHRQGFPPETARSFGVPQQQVRPGLRGVQRQDLGPRVQPPGEPCYGSNMFKAIAPPLRSRSRLI